MPNGYGFMGVIEYDEVNDTVRCHECGEWFQYLGPHIFRMHGMTARTYKIKNGLNFNMALCGKRVSEQRRLQMTGRIIRIGRRALKIRQRGGKQQARPYHNGNLTEAQKNRHGLCDKQIRTRYEVVKSIVRHQPTTTDIDLHDPNLLSAISRRYGTLNKFRTSIGEQPMTRADYIQLTEFQLLQALRDFQKQNGRLPIVRDFERATNGNAAFGSYFGRFGSWNAALALAGLK